MPSNVPHGAAIERAMSAAMEVISTLPDDEDHALLLGSLEGETDIMEVLDRVIESSIADKKLAEMARERARRIGEAESRSHLPRNRHADRGGARGEPADAPCIHSLIDIPSQAAGDECR